MTHLMQGNRLFRSGQYDAAIVQYIRALRDVPALHDIVAGNVALSRGRYRASRQKSDRSRAVVCAWDRDGDSFTRAQALAARYERFAEVAGLCTRFPGRNGLAPESQPHPDIPWHVLEVRDETNFLDQAVELVAVHPADIVHLAGLRIPNVFFGILYKLLWDARVLVDIDGDEPSRAGAAPPSAVADYVAAHGATPDLKDLLGTVWTRLASGMADAFDGVTVAGEATRRGHGGEVVSRCPDRKADLRRIAEEGTSGPGKVGDFRLLIRGGQPEGPEVGPDGGNVVLSALRELLARYASGNRVRPPVVVASRLAPVGSMRILPQARLFTPDFRERASIYTLTVDCADPEGIRGRVVDCRNPEAVVELELLVDGLFLDTLKNDRCRHDPLKKCPPPGAGGFLYEFSPGLLRPGERTITVRAPDGLEAAVVLDVPRRDSHDAGRVFPVAAVSVVVPVYNAPDDLEICLERLFAHTSGPARLILIDDASTDSRIRVIYDRLEGLPNVTLLRNETNRGFAGTVNRGIEAAGCDDVVLLNSDARVTPWWLDTLRQAVVGDPRIGTATAMSDRAGAFSAPTIGNHNPLPVGVGETDYALAFARESDGLVPSVPTGNGFCMYIRRAMLDHVGVFDAAAFPCGYGEENDLCMRARKAGWRHVIADRTYVFHDRAKSFGLEKERLVSEGRAVLDARYPDYGRAIVVFSSDTRIKRARHRALAARRAAAQGVLPRALFVVATRTGGTPQTNMDLMRALDDAFETWTLHCDSHVLTLSRFGEIGEEVVAKHTLSENVDPLSHSSFEYDRVVSGWLERHLFDLVHIRHLAWHGLSLPRLARAAGAAVVMSFHDYYTACPTVKLLDAVGRYCGGICPEGEGEGDCGIELWPPDSLPPLKGKWVREWRAMFSQALRDCDAYVTTSPSARDTILGTLTDLDRRRFFIVPHGRDFEHMGQERSFPKDRLRILVPGNINAAKGLDVIAGLLEMDVGERLEFHVLGNHQFTRPYPRLFLHGPYSREGFIRHVRHIKPHVGAIFSIWNETWCHTLTEVWSAGLPAMVFDYPTLAGRVRESGAGWVYDQRDLSRLYADIVRDGFDAEGLARRFDAVREWQAGIGGAGTTRIMACGYHEVYRTALARRTAERAAFCPAASPAAPRPRVAVVCPANTDLRHAYASTYIRIWERTRNTPGRPVLYARMTPAQLLCAVRTGEITRAIVQRNALSAEVWEEIAPAVAAGRLHFLLDLDDDLLAVPENKDLRGIYADYRPTMRAVIAGATRVAVSTGLLRDAVAGVNSRVSLFPNALSERLWSREPTPRVSDGTVRALYFGSPTHDDDLALVMPALSDLAARMPHFRLRLIGISGSSGAPRPDWIEAPVVEGETKEYPRFVSWLQGQASECDFGIAPLVADPFNAAKSALKLLEYAALGLPVLASTGPVYEETARAAPAAVTVENTTQAWTRAIDDMVERLPWPEAAGAMHDWALAEYGLSGSLRLLDEEILSWPS